MRRGGEKNHKAREQEMILVTATGTETCLKIDMGIEDPAREAPAQATGEGVTELLVLPTVELEEAVEEETETKIQDRKMEKEKVEVIKIKEGVTPAMGRAEKLAQRPLVMGGSPVGDPMARCLPKDHLICRTPGSPVGFWPNPDKEYFYKVQTPPWLLPKKRKPKGDTQEFYYDLSDEELKWKHSGEITTSNRFDLLSQEDNYFSLTNKEVTPSSSRKNEFKFNSMQAPDFSSNFSFDEYKTCDTQKSVYKNYVDTSNNFITQKSVLNKSFKDFMLTKDKLSNNNSHYMYSNKHNFCSGYSPDFITLDSIDGYNFSKGSDYSHYYLYVNNNMYLKPLSNPVSKYNNNYFDKLRHAYKISKVQGWWNTEKGTPKTRRI